MLLSNEVTTKFWVFNICRVAIVGDKVRWSTLITLNDTVAVTRLTVSVAVMVVVPAETPVAILFRNEAAAVEEVHVKDSPDIGLLLLS